MGELAAVLSESNAPSWDPAKARGEGARFVLYGEVTVAGRHSGQPGAQELTGAGSCC